MIFSRESHQAPEELSLLNEFERTLATSLATLKPNDSSPLFSLSWMRHAVESLSEIHTKTKDLITDLQFPVSVWEEKWIDIYLNDSVKLLDICIAITSELSRLDQGQLSLQYVFQILEMSNNSLTSEQLKLVNAALHDWLKLFICKNLKLENCHDILKNFSCSPFPEEAKCSAKGCILMRALYGVKVETLMVCSVIIVAVSGCSKYLLELHVPNKFLWSNVFNELLAVLLPEIRAHLSSKNSTFLKEVEAVKMCVWSLHDLTGCAHNSEEIISNEVHVIYPEGDRLNRNELKEVDAISAEKLAGQGKSEILKELFSDLAIKTEKLSEELDLLSSQVDRFFQIVLTGRQALLSNLRSSNMQTIERNREESIC
ncbi:hypothetical protein HPP92_014553 [Vanilla planifolia]|uniref:Uncharacterized protein n=1 Tax=Vanilla planifolia TaxID=51239 RepID=A0A835QW21_VANPL|nr:hypothetical protein HPP92_014553 [Vanilla planifolia]